MLIGLERESLLGKISRFMAAKIVLIIIWGWRFKRDMIAILLLRWHFRFM